jgi:hypothetical protein
MTDRSVLQPLPGCVKDVKGDGADAAESEV